MRASCFTFFILSIFLFNASAQTLKLVKFKDISKHIGDSVTVVGKVNGITQDKFGHPCLIIDDEKSDRASFFVIIESKRDFLYNPFDLQEVGKLSFTGKIERDKDHKDVSIMMIYSSKQITLTSKQFAVVTQPPKKPSKKQVDSLIGLLDSLSKRLDRAKVFPRSQTN
jgi:hypothetical protein